MDRNLQGERNGLYDKITGSEIITSNMEINTLFYFVNSSIKLHIGNLEQGMTKEELASLFKKFGQPFNVYIHAEHRFGFIEYATME